MPVQVEMQSLTKKEFVLLKVIRKWQNGILGCKVRRDFFGQLLKTIGEVIFVGIMSLGTGEIFIRMQLSLVFCLRLNMNISNNKKKKKFFFFAKYARFL